MNRLLDFLKERFFLVIGILILTIGVGGYFLWPKISSYFLNNRAVKGEAFKQVDAPTIINGELVLPKVYDGGLVESKDKIQVLSAFLVGVFEESPSAPAGSFGGTLQQQPKLVGIRILGELTNLSNNIISEVSPVVRFYDGKDKLISQKIAKITPGFDFFSFKPGDKFVYDVLVSDPPVSEKLEILFNVAKSEKKPSFETLKIGGAKLEVKTAKYSAQGGQARPSENESSESAEATPSAAPVVDEVEYYTLSGEVQNNLVDSVSDASIYAWVKNSEGKVISFARQDFKGDLLSPKKKVKFKINLLPFKFDEKMESYGVAAWGKRYKL